MVSIVTNLECANIAEKKAGSIESLTHIIFSMSLARNMLLLATNYL
jgi:hypothetical protein